MDMLNELINADFNLYSLLIFSFLPFVALYIRGMQDFAVAYTAIASIVVVLVLYKIPNYTATNLLLVLALLHLLQLILSILIVYSGGKLFIAKKVSNAKKRSEFQVSNDKIEDLTWDDLVIDSALKKELQLVIKMLKDPKIADNYGIELPKGIMFAGPPGNGKTTIAKVLANNAGVSFFILNLSEVISKWVGDSEKNLSALFKSAQAAAPAIIFIDEIDAVGRSRSGEQQVSERLLNHMLQLIDGVIKTQGIYIIGATNRPDIVDAALKRPGRLNKTYFIPNPSLAVREKLFLLYLKKIKLEDGISVQKLAEFTDGFSGADIRQICNQAGLNAFAREEHVKTRKREYQVSADDMVGAINSLKQSHANAGDVG